jgi:hypothetical protein
MRDQLSASLSVALSVRKNYISHGEIIGRLLWIVFLDEAERLPQDEILDKTVQPRKSVPGEMVKRVAKQDADS